jgi:hypothetical protein
MQFWRILAKATQGSISGVPGGPVYVHLVYIVNEV